jgi:hypothetical protein
MTGDTFPSFQGFLLPNGQPKRPTPSTHSWNLNWLGVVLLAEPFGVARPPKIWAHAENGSAEKVEYPLHISHEHCSQHHETLKLHHCQNKMG